MESRPDYDWDWHGAPTHQHEGRIYYNACKQVWTSGKLAGQEHVYSRGDVIFCYVDEEERPWVAQCVDFCFDPTIYELIDAEKGDNVDPRELPNWMPMRVSLRWLYRTSDVVEDKKGPGADLLNDAHPFEVFVTDHMNGTEVNSVNIIDGRAHVYSDPAQVPREQPNDSSVLERIYLCTRFYRHRTTTAVPKIYKSSKYCTPEMWAQIRFGCVRPLATGELGDILKRPTSFPFLFFGREEDFPEKEEAAPPRRRAGRPKKNATKGKKRGRSSTGRIYRRKRMHGSESPEEESDDDDSAFDDDADMCVFAETVPEHESSAQEGVVVQTRRSLRRMSAPAGDAHMLRPSRRPFRAARRRVALPSSSSSEADKADPEPPAALGVPLIDGSFDRASIATPSLDAGVASVIVAQSPNDHQEAAAVSRPAAQDEVAPVHTGALTMPLTFTSPIEGARRLVAAASAEQEPDLSFAPPGNQMPGPAHAPLDVTSSRTRLPVNTSSRRLGVPHRSTTDEIGVSDASVGLGVAAQGTRDSVPEQGLPVGTNSLTGAVLFSGRNPASESNTGAGVPSQRDSRTRNLPPPVFLSKAVGDSQVQEGGGNAVEGRLSSDPTSVEGGNKGGRSGVDDTQARIGDGEVGRVENGFGKSHVKDSTRPTSIPTTDVPGSTRPSYMDVESANQATLGQEPSEVQRREETPAGQLSAAVREIEAAFVPFKGEALRDIGKNVPWLIRSLRVKLAAAYPRNPYELSEVDHASLVTWALHDISRSTPGLPSRRPGLRRR